MDNQPVIATCGYLITKEVKETLRKHVPFRYWLGMTGFNSEVALVAIEDHEADLKSGRFRMLRPHNDMKYDLRVEASTAPEVTNILNILGEVDYEWAIGRIHSERKKVNGGSYQARIYTSELEAIDFKLRIP